MKFDWMVLSFCNDTVTPLVQNRVLNSLIYVISSHLNTQVELI